MNYKNYLKCVIKGVMAALITTVLLTAILSLAMVVLTISEVAFSIIYVGISCLSVVIGSIIAAKAHKSNGWILGLGVGVIFYIALYIIGILCGAESIISIYIFIKFALCALIGLLAGMLGINL